MKIITVSPFRTNLNLPTGVTDFSGSYSHIIGRLHRALAERAKQIHKDINCRIDVRYPGELSDNTSSSKCDDHCRFLNPKKDNKDIRLAEVLVFPDKEARDPEQAAVISIYNSTLGIAKVPCAINSTQQFIDPESEVDRLRKSSLQRTRNLLIFLHYQLFEPVFEEVVRENTIDALECRAFGLKSFKLSLPRFLRKLILRYLPKNWRKYFIDYSKLHFEPIGEYIGFNDLNEIIKNENKNRRDGVWCTAKPSYPNLGFDGGEPVNRDYFSKRELLFDQRMLWPTFTMVLDRGELAEDRHQLIVREWLANTICPEDADRIISGAMDAEGKRPLDYSFTWLNYLYVARPESPGDVQCEPDKRMALLFDALHLAQYFYAAHDICAQNLQRALSGAFTRKHTGKAEEVLKNLSSRAQYNQIQLNELRLELNREKKEIFDHIMDGWDHEELFANGQRMITMTRQRLEDLDTKRKNSNSFLTDVILSAIAFLSILDLMVGLSGFSREIMSQPALLYEDADYPSTLRFIAQRDIDFIFILSGALILILIPLYGYFKRR